LKYNVKVTLSLFLASLFIKLQMAMTISQLWLCNVLEPNLEQAGGMLTQQSHNTIISGLPLAQTGMSGKPTCLHSLPSFSSPHTGLFQQGQGPKTVEATIPLTFHRGLHITLYNKLKRALQELQDPLNNNYKTTTEDAQ
jgi:hypothetical protein